MSDPSPDPDVRFRVDARRRWMVSEYIPDAGDGSPATRFRDPTDEEWAARATKDTGDAGLREALQRLVHVVEANAELVGDISIYGELNVAAEEARAALSSTAGAESGLDREGTE